MVNVFIDQGECKKYMKNIEIFLTLETYKIGYLTLNVQGV
jgi:hypothetical protein